MRRVNVAHFETGAVAAQAAGTESGETAFIGQFAQRVGLIHELRELVSGEEVADNAAERLGIDKFARAVLRSAHSHALADQPFSAQKTDTAVVLQEFADGSHAAAAEVVDIVDVATGMTEADQFFGSDHQIVGEQSPFGEFSIQAEAFINFETSDGTEVITFNIEKEALDQLLGVFNVRRITRAHLLVNFLQSLFAGTFDTAAEAVDKVVIAIGDIC